MPLEPQTWLIRLDYSTGTTPLDRLKSLDLPGDAVALVNWPNSTPYCFGWDGRDGYDYRPLEALLESLQAARPGLRFILSFGSLHGAPYYWAKDHPEELARFNCGRRMQQPSLGSAAWRADSCEAARRFASNFAGDRWGESVVGFFPYSTAVEWHGIGETLVNIPEKETPKNMSDPLEGDISAPMQAAFRAYLKDRYKNDAALQAAWRCTGVSLDTARLPNRVEVRSPTPRTRDYFDCYNRLNASLAVEWSEALVAGAPGKAVYISHGMVYGWPARNLHPQGCGHNAPGLLLASPAITGLMSSPAAGAAARNAHSQHAVGSLRLHGKQHVLSVEPPNQCRIEIDDLISELILAAGQAAVQGSLIAWGEVRHGPGSMQDDRERYGRLPYDDPAIRELIGKLNARHAAHLRADHSSNAEMAVFISPTGSHQRALEPRFNRERIEAFRNNVLSQAGICFDEFHAEDFDVVADRYKAWLFIDCPDLGDAAWQRVQAEPQRACFATAGEPVNADSLRAFVRSNQIHVWTESGARMAADAGALVIAATTDGEVTLELPAATTLQDALSGETAGTAVTSINLNLKKGAVRLFNLQPA